LDLGNIKNIFTGTVNKTYIPLTIFTFALEYHFFGYNPFVFHLNNLILHLAVVVLIFWFARQIGLSPKASAFGALLFGIHPMHVESVAWVTERKDVLYAFFYLLALNFYWRYLSHRKATDYIFTIVWGILSMLAKPMALSLPLAFFVCDWWKNRKWNWAVVLDKIPHLLYIIPMGWITYIQHARIPGKENLWEAVLIWIWTLTFYIKKFVFPVILLPLYDLPKPVSLSNPHYLFAIAILALLIFAVIRLRKNKLFLLALIYYFVSIFFLLRYDEGFDLCIVADRFMYLPSLGICFFLGVLLEKLLRNLEHFQGTPKRIMIAGVVGLFLLLGTKSFLQMRIWANGFVLWDYVLSKSPSNFIAYRSRGIEYYERKDLVNALADYNKAITLGKDYYYTFLNRGNLLRDQGDYPRAIEDYNQVLVYDSQDADAYNNRGIVYHLLGQLKLALADFNKAISIKPDYVKAYSNRGLIYTNLGQLELAMADYNKALELDSNSAEAYSNRGGYYLRKEQYDLAIEEFNKALKLNPKFVGAYLNRGLAFGGNAQWDESLKDIETALKLNPDSLEAFIKQSFIYQVQNRYDEAIEVLNQASELESRAPDKFRPNFAKVYNNRGLVFISNGQFEEALKDFNKAIQLDPDLVEAYSNRGSSHLYNEQYDLAIADFDKVIRLNPQFAEVYSNRGLALLRKEKFDLALKDVMKAIELDPQNTDAYLNKSLIYTQQKEYDEAIVVLSEAINFDPKSSLLYFYRSKAFRSKGDTQKALEDALKAQSLGFKIEESYLKELKK